MPAISRLPRRFTASLAALTIAFGAVATAPALALPPAGHSSIKVFRSSDGRLTMVCFYTDEGELAYCDVYYS